jgi:hypothetical protein
MGGTAHRLEVFSMRRIPEQCGPEPVSPIVGTSRLKAGGFFCHRRIRTLFCSNRRELRQSSKRCVMRNKRVQCMARRTIV